MIREAAEDANCPYCGRAFAICVDRSPGRRNFVTECEACRKPVEVELDVDDDGSVNLITKRMGEG